MDAGAYISCPSLFLAFPDARVADVFATGLHTRATSRSHS